MNAKRQRMIRAGLSGLIVAVLGAALAACSQPGPTDVAASEDCVLIRDQIYCP